MSQTGHELSWVVERQQKDAEGVRLSVRLVSSSRPQLTNNELLVILNQLRHSAYVDPQGHVGFDYTLDFPLAQGHGFPYALDMRLEDEIPPLT